MIFSSHETQTSGLSEFELSLMQ